MSDSYADWRERFAEAMDPRFYNLAYLDWLIRSDTAQFLAGRNAALVAEIKTFPTGTRAASFVVAAGDLRELTEDLRPIVEDWGRLNGCTAALIESREGWEKVMKKHGYTLFQASIVKEL